MPVTAGRSPDARPAGSKTSNITLRDIVLGLTETNDCGCQYDDGVDYDGPFADCPCAGDECMRCAAEMALANDDADRARMTPAPADVHEESRDGGRTWALVSTPASGQVDMVDGVMVRKAVTGRVVEEVNRG